METKRHNGGAPPSENKLTLFGEKMREFRRAKQMLLMDVARVAGVSPGFLSQVETGKKPIPERLVPAIVAGLDLTAKQAAELQNAAELSANKYRIQLTTNAGAVERKIAHMMQNGLAKMTPTRKAKILKLLEED